MLKLVTMSANLHKGAQLEQTCPCLNRRDPKMFAFTHFCPSFSRLVEPVRRRESSRLQLHSHLHALLGK